MDPRACFVCVRACVCVLADYLASKVKFSDTFFALDVFMLIQSVSIIVSVVSAERCYLRPLCPPLFLIPF